LYKILSRECVKNRCGKYTVEFSIPWPKDAKTIHLLMDLSSWSPGLFPLTKIGSRGYIRLKLWEGVYLYAFMINLNELAIDPENDFFIKGLKVNYLNKTIDASIARVGVDEIIEVLMKSRDVNELVTHVEWDQSYISKLNNYWIVRIRTPKDYVNAVHLDYKCGSRNETIKMEKTHSNDIFDYYECLLSCNEDLNYVFKLISKDKRNVTYFGYGGINDSKYLASRVSKVRPLTNNELLGNVILEVSMEDVMDRYSDVINSLKYFLIDYVYVRLPPVTIIKPEEMIKADDGIAPDIADSIRSLVKRGYRVLVEVPLTYVSPCFSGFIDVIEKGIKSDYWDWFLIFDEGLSKGLSTGKHTHSIKGSCYMVYEILKELANFNSVAFEDRATSLLRLNVESPNVLRIIEETVKFWAKLGISGLIIKKSFTIPQHLINAIVATAKDINPNIAVFGESLGNPHYLTNETMLDGVVDSYLGNLIASLITGTLACREFCRIVLHNYVSKPFIKDIVTYPALPKEIGCGVLDETEMKLLYLLITSIVGLIPIRFTDIISCSKRLRKYIRSLVKIVKTLNAIRIGRLIMNCIDRKVLMVKRLLLNEVVYVLLNLSRVRVSVDLGPLRVIRNKPYRNLIDMSKVKGVVKLNPKSGAIIKEL